MSNVTFLPIGWVSSTIGQWCVNCDSKRIPINSDERKTRLKGKADHELFPYYGATGQVGRIDGYLFDGEYVLIGEDGAPFLEAFKNKAYMASGRFWVNNHAHILAPSAHPKYVCHYLNQFRYADHVTGTTRLKLTKSALEQIPIAVAPFNEQRRIVEKIEELFSELDQGIENLKQARAQLAVYRQALLKHAFEGKLTADWRKSHAAELEPADQLLARIRVTSEARYQPIIPNDIARLPALPAGWAYARFGAFTESIDAGKSFRCEERRPRGSEVGVAKVSAVSWGEYQEAETKTCLDQAKINPGYFIKNGDFLLSRANTIDLVGACVIVKNVTQQIMLSDKTLRVSIKGPPQEYFLHYLRGRQGRLQIMARSTGNQESMRNIGQDRIRSIVVPVCSPAEAAKIVEFLETQFSVIAVQEADIDINLKKSEALRQSILKKAFTGELVPQDPTDEPAAVLLARIRAERTAIPKSVKRVRRPA